MEIRRVRLRLSGGFAGVVRGSEVSANELTAAERSALAKALGGSARSRSEQARDLVVYELEVDTSSGSRTLEFDESSTPDSLVDLIDRLSRQAKPIPL